MAKLYFLFLLSIALLGQTTLAQKLLPFCHDKGCGYVDEENHAIKIPLIYKKAGFFDHQGMAKVVDKNNREHFINEKGDKYFGEEGFFFVLPDWQEELCFIADKKNILDRLKKSPNQAYPALTKLEDEELEGAVIDRKGNVILRGLNTNDCIDVFPFQELNTWGFKAKGGFFWQEKFNDLGWTEQIWQKDDGRCLFTEWLGKAKFKVIEAELGYFALRKNEEPNSVALINKNGDFILDFERFSDISNYGQGLFVASSLENAELKGFINVEGLWQIKPKYLEAQAFKNGFALVLEQENESYAYIKQNGESLKLPSIQKGYAFNEGFGIFVHKSEDPSKALLGLVDSLGQDYPMISKYIFYPLVGAYQIESGSLFVCDSVQWRIGLIDVEGRWRIPPYLSGHFIIGPALYQPPFKEGWTSSELFFNWQVALDTSGRLALPWEKIFLELEHLEEKPEAKVVLHERPNKLKGRSYLKPYQKEARPLFPKVYSQAKVDAEILSYNFGNWVWYSPKDKLLRTSIKDKVWRKVLVCSREEVWRWGYVLE